MQSRAPLLFYLCSISMVACQRIFDLSNDVERQETQRNKSPKDFSTAKIVTGNCYVKMSADSFYTPPNNRTVCRYRGGFYEAARQWIDNENCRACVCIAPYLIHCCQIDLVPTKLPTNCAVDGRVGQRSLPRIATCLAPLVRKDDPSQPCRPRGLRRALAGKEWLPSRENPSEIAVAVRSKRMNSKRSAVRMAEEDVLTLLMRYLANFKGDVASEPLRYE